MLLPAEFVRDPAAMQRTTWSRTESLAYTHWLATHHYENFHVVSFLLPKRLHQDFYNVYSFCRWADDLGDEIGDKTESLRLLDWWRGELDAMYAGEMRHPVFTALRGTVERYGIPKQPFSDLIRAFVQDQSVARYDTWEGVLDYCVYSANPVGRLVLYLCGYSDAERQSLSDKTCTALQLANFWQDVTVDLEKDRVYIPLEVLARNHYSVEDLFSRRMNESFRSVMVEIVERAQGLFLEGLPLARKVDRRLGIDLDLFSRGGMHVLKKIEQQNYDVLSRRPAISKLERAGLLLGFGSQNDYRTRGMTLDDSYSYCRKIARTRAKNFYYSFVLLSTEQKNAMCAIYAFMRYCDDLSDEPGAAAAPIERWREDLTRALAGDANPAGHVWPAFQDAVRRYGIPREYFYEMIDGVLSDLQPRRMQTFDELYCYCYQVASVVGLSIIHIFGFESPEALPLAEKCGIAFQLTNILRDVREDAELDRIYLPAEDLARFGVTPEDLREGRKTEAFARMMDFEAARARRYYDESRPLLNLVHQGSRSSLWALITIYASLLERIRKSNYDVLSRRIRLTTFEKSFIVLRAMCGGL